VNGRPAVFLDRDGVINENREDYVLTWDQFHFIPGSIEAIRRLTEAGWPIVVVTNQSAIGRGIVKRRVIDDINLRMCATVNAAGGHISRVVICPHHPDAGCRCRKPKPGLLRAAARDLGIDLHESVLIGDSAADLGAAAAVGCRAILVRTGHGAGIETQIDPARVAIAEDLSEAVDLLVAGKHDAVESTLSTEGDYFDDLGQVLTRIDRAAVARLIERIRQARDRGATIYTLGNGGSAATASHLALDLAKNTRDPRRPAIKIFALTDNSGLITAWANDAHYDEVFAAQLDAVVERDDLIIAVSGSGNSANVLRAIQLGRASGADTFGITGFQGGRLAQSAHDCVVVPSENMQHIEDAHLAIVHAVMVALRDEEVSSP